MFRGRAVKKLLLHF